MLTIFHPVLYLKNIITMTELIEGTFTPITVQMIEQDEDYDSENKVLIGILLSIKVSDKKNYFSNTANNIIRKSYLQQFIIGF